RTRSSIALAMGSVIIESIEEKYGEESLLYTTAMRESYMIYLLAARQGHQQDQDQRGLQDARVSD
ncbi:hypothetical protein, partial [Klebsiella aerogenes]|uniref:hypothetical protein n=1 Tax=Klebsiella aerogenes TaxID=548 RepID=UPI0019533EE6